jgi:hypothetical protein
MKWRFSKALAKAEAEAERVAEKVEKAGEGAGSARTPAKEPNFSIFRRRLADSAEAAAAMRQHARSINAGKVIVEKAQVDLFTALGEDADNPQWTDVRPRMSQIGDIGESEYSLSLTNSEPDNENILSL